ncbi:MAG: glycosyltransferase family 4 protein [Pseudomonadota bacterium]
MPDPADTPVRVLIITRAPVGGLWRHILDLTDGLLERGFELGIVVDKLRASSYVHQTLDRFAPRLALGVHALDMPRLPGWSDIAIARRCRALAKELKADIVHGHSAKGGLYARLASAGRPQKSVYTPHGGSLHYNWSTLGGKVFLSAERALMRLGDSYLFESAYSRDGFRTKIGDPQGRARVVYNGLRDTEFADGPVWLDEPDYDFAFVGEMRTIKGVDLVLEALDGLERPDGHKPKVLMLGDGPLLDAYKRMAEDLGLAEKVHFAGRQPVRQAFAATNTLLVPSRAESLPYIVMESIAAGKQVIATDVGGIGEIFGPTRDALVPSEDVTALREAMASSFERPVGEAQQKIEDRFAFVRQTFHVDTMVDQVAAAYRELLGRT